MYFFIEWYYTKFFTSARRGLTDSTPHNILHDMNEKRIEAIAKLENALNELESGEGLSTFVEGHGLQI